MLCIFINSICALLLITTISFAGDTFPGTTITGSGSIGGNNTGANVEVGEPTAGNNTAFNPVNSIWYSWTAPGNGVLVAQTCGVTVSTFDTVLGIYTGASVGGLTSQAFNDDATGCAVSGNNNYGSSISLNVTAGTTYRIQVDGYGGGVGTFLLQYNFFPAAQVLVLVSDATAIEGVAADPGTFQIRLGSIPTGNVTVNITADPTGQCTFSTATLTFTTANWNTLQNVVAVPVDDAIAEGTHTCSTGAITATGGGFTGQTGTPPIITIADNDTASLIVLTTDAAATEGGDTAAFTVRLGAQPSANVTVTIGSSPQCTFATTPLTFNNANWATNQTVTVTAINDTVIEGPHSCITGAIAATNGGYTGVTGAAQTFTINDNDVGAITIVNTIATATEGGATGTFTVVLTAQPATDVTVTIATGAQCTFLPSPLTFTNGNWNTAQTVTTTAINDVIVEGAHTCTTGVISASGSGYTGVTGTAPTFTITDNDVGAITIVNTIATATEGGATGTFTVVLTAQPAANVTVTIATGAQCTFLPSPLTFTNTNWNTAQTVTTTAINDVIVEGAHSCTTGVISASGSGYTGVTGTAPTFTITDNDVGAITVVNTDTTATEGVVGATGAFTVVLTAQPATDVTVTIATGAQCTFLPSPLTFTNANWNTAQTVTTTAINDVIVEGAHSCTTGAISASGSGYTGVTGTAPTFTITDNDVGAITVVNTIATATEGGANGAFTVVLTAQPATDVTVTIATGAQCTFLPSPLTFTNGNWNTAQTVTTTAINDVIVEGAHSCTTGVISASGSGYTGVTGTAPTFAITDNDVGAITIVNTIATATEGGATGAFTVVLTAQPAANVTVTIATGAQCTFLPSPLTFTNGNWNTAQTVTTTAINDVIVEGAHSCTTGAISASGSGYNGVTGTAPTFAITDNDVASILVEKTASTTSVTIAGALITYSIKITNTGNVIASGVTVTDTLASAICPTSGTNTIAALAPAGFETCTASYTAIQTDFDTNGGGDGDIDNIASASGTAGGVAVAGNDAVAVLCTPVSAMTIVKSANKAGPLNVGDIITYSFLAKNTGNVTLSDVSIQETAFNGAAPPLGTPLLETLTDNLPLNTLLQQSTDVAANNGVWSVLKPNDEVSFQLTYTVSQSDVDLLQ